MNPDLPLFSVITVCYNSGKTIRDTIQSVVSQDYPNIEYILVDGLSQDNTLEIIQEFRTKISYIISERDHGIYDAINKGIALAKGEFVSILNSDDVYRGNEVLSSVVRKMQENEADAVYGDLDFVDRLNPQHVVRKWKAGPYQEGLFLKGWMPPHPAFFVKRQCYQNFGVFDTGFIYAADYELMLRFIHKHRIKINYLPDVLVKMRMGGFGNASILAKIKANMEDRQAWTKNELKAGILTLWLKPFRKIFQFKSF